MQANVGGIDRTMRIVIGSVLLLVSMTSNAIGLWGVLGMIPIGYRKHKALFRKVSLQCCGVPGRSLQLNFAKAAC
jgi:hypothetical protein